MAVAFSCLKWAGAAAILLAIFGFDTSGPFRTRNPFRSATTSTSTWVSTWGPCTSGTDCFCDRVRGVGPQGTSDPVYNSGVYWCEDFDHDAFYATTPTDVNDSYGRNNWVSTSGALFGSGDRGGGSRWAKKYLDTDTGLTWRDGQPSTTCGSVITSVGGSGIGSGPKEYDAADRWCANAYEPWIDIIHTASEFQSERSGSAIPTIPGSGGYSIFGDNILAHRNPTTGTAGFHSESGGSFGGRKGQLGYSEAIGYESNVASSDVLLGAWKHEEFNTYRDGLVGMRQTNSPYETFPMQGFIFGIGFSCSTAVASKVVTLGNVTCSGSNLIFHATQGTGTGAYTFSTDFSLGELHCKQFYWDMRDITNVKVKAAIDGEMLINASGINLAGSDYDAGGGAGGVVDIRMNNYSNRAADPPVGVGFLSQSTRRFSDNMVARDGVPVTCSDLGFPSSYDVTF